MTNIACTQLSATLTFDSLSWKTVNIHSWIYNYSRVKANPVLTFDSRSCRSCQVLQC